MAGHEGRLRAKKVDGPVLSVAKGLEAIPFCVKVVASGCMVDVVE